MKRNKLSYAIFFLIVAGISTTFVVGQNTELQRIDQKPRRLRGTLTPVANPESMDSTVIPQYRPLGNTQNTQTEQSVNPLATPQIAQPIQQAGSQPRTNGQNVQQMQLVSHDAGNETGTENRPAVLMGPRDNAMNLGSPVANAGATATNNPVPASATMRRPNEGGIDNHVDQTSQSQHIGTMSVSGNGNWNNQNDVPEHVFQGLSQIREASTANSVSHSSPMTAGNNTEDNGTQGGFGQVLPAAPSSESPSGALNMLVPGGHDTVDFRAETSGIQANALQPESEGLIPFRPIQPPTIQQETSHSNPGNTSNGIPSGASSNQQADDHTRMSFGNASVVREQSPTMAHGIAAAPQSRFAAPEERIARDTSAQNGIRYDGSSVQLGNVPGELSQLGNEDEGTALPGSGDLAGAQIPQLVIEKIMPNEVQINEPMTIKINVRNTGAAKAKDVVLIDRLPKGARFLEAGSSATRDREGNICWALGDLNINEERTVELRLIPTAEGEIGSVATATFSVEASGSTRVTKPGLKMEVNTASDEHLVGGDMILEIHISNPGSGTARNIMIEEYVPEGLSHPKGKKLSATFGDLKPNESKRLKLTLKCERAGETTNYLVAKAENDLIVESKIPIVVLAPGLVLDIVGPKNRYLERKATYELHVENPGSAAAHEIQLVAQLPRGIDFDSTDSMGVYDPETHTVHWMLDTLPSRQSGTIKLVTMPRDIGDHKIEFIGRAQGNLQANASHEVSVDGIAALGFEITNKSGPVELGRDAVYEIRVFNRGTKASTNIGLCVQLPEDMRYVDANGPTQSQVSGSMITFGDLLQLSPRAEKIYTVKAQCLAAGDHRVIVQMQSDEMERPVTKEENTNVYGDE